MLLHHKAVLLAAVHFAFRLGRLVKPALLVVLV
jgi:hypothetical protein